MDPRRIADAMSANMSVIQLVVPGNKINPKIIPRIEETCAYGARILIFSFPYAVAKKTTVQIRAIATPKRRER